MGVPARRLLVTCKPYATIVFDEFHLYHGIELAHALFMIHLTQRIETFKRVVLLSATPNAEVKPRLDMLLKPREIAAGANVDRRFTAERIVAYDVELLPLLTQRGDVVE